MTTESTTAHSAPPESAPPESATPQPFIPRSLQSYAVLYGGLLVVAGVLGFKLIKLAIPGFNPLAVPGGVFGFLLAIVTVNATAELHGRPVAQRMVFMGFVPLLVSLGLMQLVLALPPAEGWEGQAIAREVFGSSIRLILTRHEQAAGFMAATYGRLTGRVGVCLSTLGPGATNLVTGVADANSDGYTKADTITPACACGIYSDTNTHAVSDNLANG